jgi:hypothetical protein
MIDINRIADAVLQPASNNRSSPGDAGSRSNATLSQDSDEAAFICRGAYTLSGIAGPTMLMICGQTEAMTTGSSSEAIMLVAHNQRVGRC